MNRSQNWIYGRSGEKGRLWRTFAGIAAICLLAACAVFFGAKYILGDAWDTLTHAPAPETTAHAPAPSETTAITTPALPAVKVKGLYVTAWSAGMADRLAHYIELCDITEINALVIDVKDDRGQITFLNSIEGAAQASSSIIPDIEQMLALLKEHGIYAIARLSCFKDPLWSRLHPELALHNAHGAPWKDADGVTWLDPYNTASWEYIASIAGEAARLGFDEIQLDYVRFPAAGNLKDIARGNADAEKTRAEAVAGFLEYIRAALAGTGARLSVDIFGITAIHRGDFEDIGQDPAALAGIADFICPMVYPSHFANKRQNGVGQIINETLFEAPDLQPFDVVNITLVLLRNRLRAGENSAGIRPWLQDFTASYLGAGYFQEYTATQVREQIKAVYDAGLREWILWNASGVYSEEALLRE